jgi:phenylpropionate dioxygenase-like ring-hydroxylating dioxygenase large terminal subunit
MERKSTVDNTRLPVCHSRDIPGPGDYLVCDALSQPIVIVRGDDHEIRAFLNICRHRDMRLLSGDNGGHTGHCSGRLIRCPYHAWAYDLRGRLQQVPFGRDFIDFDKTLRNLHELTVEVQQGRVFVQPMR